jgi:hypothetical protein
MGQNCIFTTRKMKCKKTYTVFQAASAIFMILALLWLTISLPFAAASQQQLNKQYATSDNTTHPDTDEECGNPFGNNTEEKAPSSTNLAEEFLHDHHFAHQIFSVILQHNNYGNDGTYVAYHGELLVPPPDLA